MNARVLVAMVGAVIGWLALLGTSIYAGLYAIAAFLGLIAVALMLYVPWVRLREGGIAGSSLPKRIWLHGAMFAVALATCAALVVAVARRVGML